MKKILYIIGVAGVLFSSCSVNDNECKTTPTQSEELKIRSSITTRASGTTWDDNDQIGVFASQGSTIFGENIPFTTALGGAVGNFVADYTNIYFPNEGAMDVVAYYPFTASTTLMTYAVDVSQQAEPEAIDLMSASTSAEKQAEALELQFYHRLSKISVTIVAGDGVDATELSGISVKLSGTKLAGYYNLSTNEVSFDSSIAASDLDLEVSSDGSLATALLIPQAVNGTASLTFNLPTYGDFALTLATDEYISGANHTYRIRVSRTGLDLTDSDIVDWNDTTAEGDDDLTVDDLSYTIAEIVASPPADTTWRIRTEDDTDEHSEAEMDALFELLDNVANPIDIIFVDAKKITSRLVFLPRAAMLRSVSAPVLTELGDFAFNDCVYMESISMPELTTVGQSAFNDCDALEAITLSKVTTIGLFAFSYCDALKTVTLPKAEFIDDGAFSMCGKLTSISLPEATTISNDVFSHCTTLETVSLPKATTIGNSAFVNCEALINVSLPKVTTIGGLAFSSCIKLPTISLPKATVLKEYAFSNCYELKTVSLPEVTEIGEYAFERCSSLSTLSLPKAIVTAANVFNSCNALNNLSIGTDYSTEPTAEDIQFATNTFDGAPIGNINLTVGYGTVSADGKKWTPKASATEFGDFLSITGGTPATPSGYTIDQIEVSAPTENPWNILTGETPTASDMDRLRAVVEAQSTLIDIVFVDATSIPAPTTAHSTTSPLQSISAPKAKTIGANAFKNCRNLLSISIPEVTTIENNAFDGCWKMQGALSLPKVETIGNTAFKDCRAITSISAPALVVVGNNGFRFCNAVTGDISLPKAKTLGNSVFEGVKSTTIELPLAITMGSNVFSSCINLTTLSIGTDYTSEPSASEINIAATTFGNVTVGQINLAVGYGEVSDKYWTPEVGGTQFGEFASVTK